MYIPELVQCCEICNPKHAKIDHNLLIQQLMHTH